jgi:hypothetical protein
MHMSIDTCRKILAEDIEVDDELDLDGDEYGDNADAVTSYAVVDRIRDKSDAVNSDPWLTFYTSQGTFDCPAGHYLRVKVED